MVTSYPASSSVIFNSSTSPGPPAITASVPPDAVFQQFTQIIPLSYRKYHCPIPAFDADYNFFFFAHTSRSLLFGWVRLYQILPAPPTLPPFAGFESGRLAAPVHLS
jgi:hypothetical protein